MTDIATQEYARALLAHQARQMRETIAEVMRTERDPITAHKLAEVMSECVWCEKYGETNNKENNPNG